MFGDLFVAFISLLFICLLLLLFVFFFLQQDWKFPNWSLGSSPGSKSWLEFWLESWVDASLSYMNVP